MARSTLKVEKLPVPQTTADAIPMLKRWSDLHIEVAKVKLEAEDAKAEIDTARDLLLLPIAAEAKRLMAALKTFFIARQDELTDGKRKSVVLGPCRIGMRLGNPTLDYPKGDEDQLLEDLRQLGFDDWAWREKVELNKEALIAALKPNEDDDEGVADAVALIGLGFGIKQTETFFVERLETDPAVVASLGREAA